MTKNPKVFDKANSITEMHLGGRPYSDVRRRMQGLQKTLREGRNCDYRSQILRQACRSLLNQSPDGSRHGFVLRDHVVDEISRLSDGELPRYLFYRYRYDVFPSMRVVDDFPPCLQIEPTSICNYRCVFCYQVDQEFTKRSNGYMGMMNFDLFKRIVDQAEGVCEAVTLASRGEPLICPDFDKMMDYLGDKFLGLKINTNASLLDERKSHAILQAQVNTLVFSADAAADPLYSQLRVNGKLDRVLKNIRQFQELRARYYPNSRIITRVSGVRLGENQSLEDMKNLWGNMVDQVAFVDYNPWEDTYDQPINAIRIPCSDLWRRMFVWWDGTVNPCDVDYKSTLAIGRATDQNLSDLWRSDAYMELRAQHLAGQRSQCAPCNRCSVI